MKKLFILLFIFNLILNLHASVGMRRVGGSGRMAHLDDVSRMNFSGSADSKRAGSSGGYKKI